MLDVPLYPGWNRFEGFTLPGDYAFTASDAGVHTFAGGATIIFAGAQTVTATDTTTATITGSQAVTMSPGPMAGFDVAPCCRPRTACTSRTRRSRSSA